VLCEDHLDAARLFLDALEEPWRTEISDDPQLDEWLETSLQMAREAWPGARPCPGFLAYLASKVPTLRMAAAFVTLRVRELFLMYSCLHADPRALAEFETRYQPYVARVLRRLKWTAQAVEEARSVLRERLFFPVPGDRAVALDYSGRCDLGRWLRSVAVRDAFKEHERQCRHVDLEGHADDLATDENDPEQDLEMNREGAAFANSLLRALAALPLRDRKLLFRHYYEGLSLDEIAKRHRVHQIGPPIPVRTARCGECEISPETPRRSCILPNPCPFLASCTTYPPVRTGIGGPIWWSPGSRRRRASIPRRTSSPSYFGLSSGPPSAEALAAGSSSRLGEASCRKSS
jgi:RNA polymerase sigma-70 factor (ECF subfamily)